MKNRPLLLIAVLAFLLAACSTQQPQPVVPSPDQLELQSTINAAVTAAVGTERADAQANQPTAILQTNTIVPATPTTASTVQPTSTALQLPTAAPTNTNTPLPVLPTSTKPIVYATVTSTPQAFQCSVASQNPPNTVQFRPGEHFTVEWEITNTGTQRWDENLADFRMLDGRSMEREASVYDLSHHLPSGATTSFEVPFRAPDLEGNYQATWGMLYDGRTMCTVTLQLRVVP